MAAHGLEGYKSAGCRCSVCRAGVAAYMRKRRASRAAYCADTTVDGVDPVIRPSRPRQGTVAEFVRWVPTADGKVPELIEARVESGSAEGWMVFLPAHTWSHVEL